MHHVNVQFGDVSVHFTVHFPDLVLEGVVPSLAPMPVPTRPGLERGSLGRVPVARAYRVCSASSVRAQRQSRPPAHGRAARVRDRGSRQSLRARRPKRPHAAAVSWARSTPPSQPHIQVRRLIRAPDLECSATPRVQPKQPLSPRQRALPARSAKAPAARCGHADSPPAVTRRRDSPRPAPRPLLERPEIGSSMPCHVGPAR